MYICVIARQTHDMKTKDPDNQWIIRVFGGMYGTRTRDPLRDRQVF